MKSFYTLNPVVDWSSLKAEILSEKASGKGEIGGWKTGDKVARHRTIANVYSRGLGVPIGAITPLLSMGVPALSRSKIGGAVFLDIDNAEKVIKEYHARRIKAQEAAAAREKEAERVLRSKEVDLRAEVASLRAEVRKQTFGSGVVFDRDVVERAKTDAEIPPANPLKESFSLSKNMAEVPFAEVRIDLEANNPTHEKLDRIIGLLERLVDAWEK